MASAGELYISACHHRGIQPSVDFLRALEEESPQIAAVFDGDDAVAAAAAAIRRASFLVDLDLYGSSFGPAGAEALAAAIEGHSGLTKLRLRGCAIGDSGASAVTRAVSSSRSSVRSLDLSLVGLTEGGGATVAGFLSIAPSLEMVNLEENELGQRDGPHVVAALLASGVRVLGLARCGLGDAGGEALAYAIEDPRDGPCSVELLDLGGNGMGERGATALARALKEPTCPIRELILADNPLTGAGLAHLSSVFEDEMAAPALKYLDVERCAAPTHPGAVALIRSIGRRNHSNPHQAIILDGLPPLSALPQDSNSSLSQSRPNRAAPPSHLNRTSITSSSSTSSAQLHTSSTTHDSDHDVRPSLAPAPSRPLATPLAQPPPSTTARRQHETDETESMRLELQAAKREIERLRQSQSPPPPSQDTQRTSRDVAFPQRKRHHRKGSSISSSSSGNAIGISSPETPSAPWHPGDDSEVNDTAHEEEEGDQHLLPPLSATAQPISGTTYELPPAPKSTRAQSNSRRRRATHEQDPFVRADPKAATEHIRRRRRPEMRTHAVQTMTKESPASPDSALIPSTSVLHHVRTVSSNAANPSKTPTSSSEIPTQSQSQSQTSSATSAPPPNTDLLERVQKLEAALEKSEAFNAEARSLLTTLIGRVHQLELTQREKIESHTADVGSLAQAVSGMAARVDDLESALVDEQEASAKALELLLARVPK